MLGHADVATTVRFYSRALESAERKTDAELDSVFREAEAEADAP